MQPLRFGACIVMLLACVPCSNAFASPLTRAPASAALRNSGPSLRMSTYIPDGLSLEQWQAIKQKEQAKASKNLGRVGTVKFKSRSFQAFHQSLEAGHGGHLFPVDLRKVKSGEIGLSQVPYMMRRRGAWDDSDMVDKEPGAKKKNWLPADVAYANGGERAAQSVNLYGTSVNMPWRGKPAFEPSAAAAAAAAAAAKVPAKAPAKGQRPAAATPAPRPKLSSTAGATKGAVAAAPGATAAPAANKRFFFF
ncbi:hypothetical protein JKP88DRAFT_277217 [Tribonema minus]|uniref:Uncharacterized protein n=1 Tax=Tribonema minus TaxID=303371 RepID=A0A835YZT7_9STRA|nr:hypothetical protein JKP88DRAFT_277217 [Tribonema minus]